MMLRCHIGQCLCGIPRICLVGLAVVLSVSWCFAEDQDIIGVYFDDAASTSVHETTQPFEYVPYWVAVKNLSATEDFMALAFRLEVNGVGVIYMQSLIGGQYHGEYHGDFLFGAVHPISDLDLILIGTWSAYVLDRDDRHEFNIMSIDGVSYPTPIYTTADFQLHDLTPSSGDFDKPVAVINPQGSVSAEVLTWGEIKNLYD